MVKGLDVGYVDDEEIPRLATFNVEWAGKIVDFRQVNIANIVCAVIVAYLTTCPVETFYLNCLTRFNSCNTGNYKISISQLGLVYWVFEGHTIWMPSVVEMGLLRGGLVKGH